jgi:hypothetical protein
MVNTVPNPPMRFQNFADGASGLFLCHGNLLPWLPPLPQLTQQRAPTEADAPCSSRISREDRERETFVRCHHEASLRIDRGLGSIRSHTLGHQSTAGCDVSHTVQHSQQCAAPHPARISRNISAASCRDNLRRDRFNRTSAHAKAATFPLASTADSFRPAAACFTST